MSGDSKDSTEQASDAKPGQVLSESRFDEIAVTIERTLQLLYGATLTVIAGFLSQVWGTANIEFRSGIASVLNTLGGVFLYLLLVPTIRMAPSLMPNMSDRRRRIALALWTGSLVIAFTVYTDQMRKLGDLIEFFAKL